MTKTSNLALSLLTSAALVACGAQQGAGTSDPASQSQNNIIGGFASDGPTMRAVGTLGVVGDDGSYQFICTATLISPTVVLTAKHCTVFLDDGQTPQQLIGDKLVNYYNMAFAVGNALTPDATYELVAATPSQLSTGGLVGLGSDTGVYFLKTPITDITPIAPATTALNSTEVGQKFGSIGYGTQTNLQDWGLANITGTRAAGASTLNALGGQKYQLLFPTYDAFVQNLSYLYGPDTISQCQQDQTCSASLQDMWNNTPLLDGYDIYLGNNPGDVQICHGDSGGPLLTSNNGQLQIVAVASNVWFEQGLACWGNFYSALGQSAQDLIAQSANWTDPCAGGVTVPGSCNGTVATRCTGKGEGDRRLSQVDCSVFGQTCAMVNGLAGCTDPSAPPPPQAASGATGTSAPQATTAMLRWSVESAAAGLDNASTPTVLRHLLK